MKSKNNKLDGYTRGSANLFYCFFFSLRHLCSRSSMAESMYLFTLFSPRGTTRTGGALRRYQDPVFWAWIEIFFSPKRYQSSNNTLDDIATFEHAKRYQNRFLTPKRDDEHPSDFSRFIYKVFLVSTYRNFVFLSFFFAFQNPSFSDRADAKWSLRDRQTRV